MSVRRLLAPAVLALALVPAAPAAADQAVAEMGRAAPVAAYGGWEAWSSYDGATGRYTLMVAVPGQPAAPVGIPTSSRPFDVSLGPDRDHNVAAVYRRCGPSGCDIRRYNTASGHDVKLSTVSSPSFDEATPAIWAANVVFTRRVKTTFAPQMAGVASS